MSRAEAILLAAGAGTRLWPFTATTPKPLLPVANRTTLEHNLAALRAANVDRCFVNTFANAPALEDAIAGRSWGLEVVVKRETRLTGPAGGARGFLEDLRTETVLVVSGDAIHSLDLADLLRQHHARRAVLTVALSMVDEPAAFGVPALSDDGRIVAFAEKPKDLARGPRLVSCGIYCIDRSVLRTVDPSRIVDFGRDLIPALSQQSARVFGVHCDGYWRDIGRASELLRANLDAAANVFDAKPRGSLLGKNQWLEGGVRIGKLVKFEGPLIVGGNTTIEDRAEVRGPSVIGSGCTIGTGAMIANCLLLDGAHVLPRTMLANAVVGARSSA
jgi:mannose-1-phosphate guanylyltransferase/phosphomannomutase